MHIIKVLNVINVITNFCSTDHHDHPVSQEVLEHTTRAPVATLYTTASKDFGQARQILETMQVILMLVR